MTKNCVHASPNVLIMYTCSNHIDAISITEYVANKWKGYALEINLKFREKMKLSKIWIL